MGIHVNVEVGHLSAPTQDGGRRGERVLSDRNSVAGIRWSIPADPPMDGSHSPRTKRAIIRSASIPTSPEDG